MASSHILLERFDLYWAVFNLPGSPPVFPSRCFNRWHHPRFYHCLLGVVTRLVEPINFFQDISYCWGSRSWPGDYREVQQFLSSLQDFQYPTTCPPSPNSSTDSVRDDSPDPYYDISDWVRQVIFWPLLISTHFVDGYTTVWFGGGFGTQSPQEKGKKTSPLLLGHHTSTKQSCTLQAYSLILFPSLVSWNHQSKPSETHCLAELLWLPQAIS